MKTVLLSMMVMWTLINGQAPSTYTVRKISKPIKVTGKGDDPQWQKAVLLTDFTLPWEDAIAPATSFKALHDKEWLYCLFHVEDSSIHVLTSKNAKREIVRSDRVELFFKRDDSMTPYYCLEIDVLARVFDCTGNHYRKLDTNWSWPEGQLLARSSRNVNGYTVEIKIGKRSLHELGLLQGNAIQTGIFRAECTELTETGSKFRWISWIRPNIPEPDFHTPEVFGTLRLED